MVFWHLALRCPDITAHGPTERQLLDRLRRAPAGWGVQLDSGRVQQCELVARPPAAVRARPCRALRNHCARTSPLREACANHTAVVYVSGQPFRNVYCALCAGARPAQVTCSAPCAAPRRPVDLGGLRTRLTIAAGRDERCGAQEIRDPFSRSCRSVVCSRPGHQLVDGECVRTARADGQQESREDREDGEEAGRLTDLEDNLLPMQGLIDADNVIEVETDGALAQTAGEEGEEEKEDEAPGAELEQLNMEAAATEEEDLEQGSGDAAQAVEADDDEEKEADA